MEFPVKITLKKYWTSGTEDVNLKHSCEKYMETELQENNVNTKHNNKINAFCILMVIHCLVICSCYIYKTLCIE